MKVIHTVFLSRLLGLSLAKQADFKRKINRLFSSAKLILFVLALTAISAPVHSQSSYTFNFTGATQTVNLLPGTYDVKMWGADGGNSNNTRQGRGGYSNGTLTLLSTTTIYIGVGGSPAYTGSTGLQPGGYNGGGSGFANSTGRAGGGATHIATLTGVLSSLASSTGAVIMVAGGGGGDQNAGSIGHGGGSSGGGTYPGTQSGSSGSSTGLAGSFGQGGNITSSYGGGGGGGWYGGGGNQNNAGSGGSGYIGGVTNGVTSMSASTGFVSKPITALDGLVIITELCSITLSATGVNSNSAICSGNSVTLTTNAISNYSWSTSATTNSIVVSPTSTTGYTLTATSPSNCTSSAFYTVYVNSGAPSLTVVNTATNAGGVCPGRTVALTASGATTYSWTGSVVNGATFVPTSTQTYVVTGENACGTSTAATSVSIHPTPTIVLTSSQPTVCTTQSISLCPSGGVSYTMSPITPTCAPYYPFTNQTYTVRGTSALGCTNSAMATVNVTVTPVIPPVTNPTLICIGSSATVSATGASNYSWTSTGLSGVVTTSSFVANPTTSTTYSLTKWNANCVSTDSVRLIVNQLPTVFAVANPATVCASSPATLQAGGGTSYQWAPGNLPSGPGAFTVVVFPAQNTIYTVTASDGTCSGVATVSVATNPNPVISIATSTNSMCYGQTATYTISGADTYTYSNTPSSSPPFTSTTGAVSPTAHTNYQVVGRNQFSCTSSASQLIFVHPLPTITIVKSSNLVCPGFPVTFTANGAATNTVHLYSWMHGGNTNKSTVNPMLTTTYTVLGTNTVTSCQNTQTITANVFQPTFTATPDTAICRGGNITLVASGASSYSWTGGPTPANNVAFYNVSPTVQTVYTVTARSTTNTLQCYSSKNITVDIYLQPTVTASPSRTQTICKNEPVYLRGHGADTYHWPSINQNGDSVLVTIIQPSKFLVYGTDIYGCKDTFELTIKYSTCPGFDEINNNMFDVSVFPNPNNGVFTVKASFEATLKLVNELGQEVRELSLTTSNNWSVDVRDLAPGIYFITGRHEDIYINKKVMISH